jgi:[ribosomal protein S5]-alanine N-acetyltransferase
VLVTLRPITLDDTAAVHDWARLPESCRYQVWGPNTYEQTAEYVRAAVAAPPDRRVFVVLVDGEVLGSAELRLHGASSAEIAYAVHPSHWGQGTATAAAHELPRMGFSEHRSWYRSAPVRSSLAISPRRAVGTVRMVAAT